MSNWAGGYMADIPYTHGFYRELTPSLMRLCAVLSGVQPPEGERAAQGPAFNYCELGFGQGLTACLLASANSRAQFYGTDFNPDHLLTARGASRAASLTNAHWFDDGFDEFNRRDLPQFDYVVMHGIYSWVNEPTRQQIRDFLRQRLRPGGMVYLSYNTLPGWAATSGLRQMLFEYATHHVPASMPPTERIDHALRYLERLRTAGSKYFGGSQDATARLLGLTTLDRTYLVHEFLNEAWTPFYSRAIAGQMREAKLGFIGSGNVHDHFDALCFSGDALKLIQETADPTLRQTTRDYLLNTTFRRDLFSRGTRPLSSAERTRLLLDTRFALASLPNRISKTLTVPIGEINLNEGFLNALIGSLGEGPKTLRALTTEAALKAQGLNGILQMLAALIGAGDVLPCVPESEYDTAAAQRFNLALAEQAIEGGQWWLFASPLTGSGLAVNRLQQLFVAARARGHTQSEGWARFAFDQIYPQGQRVTVEGKTLEKPEDNLNELRSLAKSFEQHLLPLLKMHGAL